MPIKYQIFISSTYEDLKDERDQVIRAILEMGHIPVGMEMFSAADDDQWRVIARQIEEADYYVVILAHRYGSTTATGIGFTEKEYDYAISCKVPVLGFVIDDKVPWPPNLMEADEQKRARLLQFRTKVRGRMVQPWTDKNHLHARVNSSLSSAFTTTPRTGWIRASEASAIQGTPEAINFGASSRLKIDIYYHTDLLTREAARNVAGRLLRVGMLPRVIEHVPGVPDAFFIGSLVTASEVRTVLSQVDPKLLRFLFPPDYPESEGGDSNGRRIGLGYTSQYNTEAQKNSARTLPHPVSQAELQKLLDQNLSNAQLHRLIHQITDRRING